MDESLFGIGQLHDSVRAYGVAKMALARGSGGLWHAIRPEMAALRAGNIEWAWRSSGAGPVALLGGMAVRAVQEQRAGKAEFTVWGSPETVREALYVDDQIEAILAADARFENMVLNCAANQPVTIGQSAGAIVKALGWNAKIVYPGGTFDGVSRKLLDSSKFLGATGWKPRIGLEEGLRLLVEDIKVRIGLTA